MNVKRHAAKEVISRLGYWRHMADLRKKIHSLDKLVMLRCCYEIYRVRKP